MNPSHTQIIASDNSMSFMLVFNLLLDCPQALQPDCPFAKIRHLSVRERYLWVASLSQQKLSEAYKAHQACLLRQTVNKLSDGSDSASILDKTGTAL